MTATWLPAPAPTRTATSRAKDALVHRHDLGDVAWQVLVHDGDLVPVTETTGVPAGVTVRPWHRAAALAAHVDPGQVLVGQAAVWVHTGGEEPLHADTTETDPQDAVRLGGTVVAGVLRTALDVAARYPAPTALPLLVRLADHAGLDLDAAWHALGARAGFRGVRQADRTLRAARARVQQVRAARPGASTSGTARSAAARSGATRSGATRAATTRADAAGTDVAGTGPS
ncbi:MAG TPA: hypothetical protein VGC57_05780 [Cellulomonas sp.]